MESVMNRVLLLALLLCLAPYLRAADAPATGVTVNYQLPTDGPLPKTYRVTLAATDIKNPDWIVSTFASGVVRTVTTENQGKFTETWDGLDENLMPIPPGEYGVKGIYMPAKTWKIDGEAHTIVPKLVAVASSFGPDRERDTKAEPFGGDPCGSPLRDVAVGPNGIGVFYYQYLENGTNNPLIDFNKPVGFDQVLAAYGSGGAAGGLSTCTDGKTIWSYCKEGGPAFIYRADGKSFGKEKARYRRDIYLAKATITALAAWTNDATKKSFVYVAQKDQLNEITILDGETSKELAKMEINAPEAVMVRADQLFSVHPAKAGGWEIVSVKLKDGLPDGDWKTVFALDAKIKPADAEVDSKGNFYVSDSAANKVYKFSPEGKPLLTLGKLDAQKPGAYDPLTFMSPAKLATWKDAEGNDRLIVIENDGPNRASEWSSDGKLLREWLSLQTKANDGYAIDPENPEHAYVGGQNGWLNRFRIDYEKGAWVVDAVWPKVGDETVAGHFDHPKVIRRNGQMYLACCRSYNIYRLQGDRWMKSAAIISEKPAKGPQQRFLWSDTNGDGEVQDDEFRKNTLSLPGALLRYWGENWINDLSLVAMNQAGREVWRLAPASFDERGTPIFTGSKFEKIFTDSVLEARAQGTADALHGANELATIFSSDWAMTDGTMEEGFYVNSRGGPNFSANEGAQIKISRYIPDGKGGFTQKWRVGRTPLRGLAQNGELYGTIFITKPMNGLVGVTDNSRAGIVLYTEDGLYVDSLFPDGRRFNRSTAGVYPQPGEFFAGFPYANKKNGKVYLAMGKYTPIVFEAEGWSLTESSIQRLTKVDSTINISAAQISPPPAVVAALKGGTSSRTANFAPAPGGGPALDGSMNGWDACDPLQFQSDKDQTVEVRCAYDPEHIFVRWHARLASKFEAKALQPFERIFTHDRLSDTVSLYLQCDPNAKPNGPKEGRAGDLRVVFGIFKDADALKPVALGLYPKWTAGGKANALTYGSPVGKASFEHVALIDTAKLGHTIDADGKGFVIAASIPRSALPMSPELSGKFRTQVNFEATFGGHNKFWWSNADGTASRETYDEPTEARLYPGSWAQGQFQPLSDQLVVRTWSVVGPFGGPEAKEFKDGPNEMKKAIAKYFDETKYALDDRTVDLKAVFTGPQTITNSGGPTGLKWQSRQAKSNEDFIPLGHAGQLYFASAWIYSPVDQKLDCTLAVINPQNIARFSVGSQTFPVDSNKGDKFQRHKTSVEFKQGWNQVFYRGYCVGYSSRVGFAVHGTPEQLWSLKCSSTPPEK